MSSDCPVCDAGLARIVFADASILALRDIGERAESCILLAPRRHVARWRDLTDVERNTLSASISGCQEALEQSDAGPSSVRFEETSDHFHIVITRATVAPTVCGKSPAQSRQDIDAPIGSKPGLAVAPHARALIAGGEDALFRHLVPHIDAAKEIDAAISFAMSSGVRLLASHLQDMLERGGRLRLAVGDYLDVTEPEALRRLTDLSGDRALFAFRASRVSFHPKAWIFRFTDGAGALIVGSSNLSETALRSGIEWNLRLFGDGAAPALTNARAEFDALLGRPETVPLTDAWIENYEARRSATLRPSPTETGVPEEAPLPPPTPHEVQREALEALVHSRARSNRAGLVVLATGLGKTLLAAFDSRAFRRVLFVAHREEILTQAMATFRARPAAAQLGRFVGGGEGPRGRHPVRLGPDTQPRRTPATASTPDAFDYIVVDEFHHAAAAHLPQDDRALSARLPARADRHARAHATAATCWGSATTTSSTAATSGRGIARGLLAPFHYFGVPDDVDYAQIPWRSGRFDEEALTDAVATKARAENALEQLRAAAAASRTIGFCVSRRHADFMARVLRASAGCAPSRSIRARRRPRAPARSKALAARRARHRLRRRHVQRGRRRARDRHRADAAPDRKSRSSGCSSSAADCDWPRARTTSRSSTISATTASS